SEGEALIRRPAQPHSWNVPIRTPTAIRPSRFAAASRVLPNLPNRPVIVMVSLRCECDSLAARRAIRRRCCLHRSDDMAVPDYNLVDGPSAAVLRREFALLNCSFDVEVLSLLE